MGTDLDYLTIAEGAARIRTGDLSPVEWTRHLIARIEALNPGLNAFVVVTAEHALDQAGKAEAEIKFRAAATPTAVVRFYRERPLWGLLLNEIINLFILDIRRHVTD